MRLSRQKIFGRDIHDFARLVERLPRWVLGLRLLPFHPTRRRSRLQPLCCRAEKYAALKTPSCGSTVVASNLPVETVRSPPAKTVAEPAGGKMAEFDAIVMATGYSFAAPFLPAGVPRTPAGHPLATHNEILGWPNLFLVGFPCARSLASEYLRGDCRRRRFRCRATGAACLSLTLPRAIVVGCSTISGRRTSTSLPRGRGRVRVRKIQKLRGLPWLAPRCAAGPIGHTGHAVRHTQGDTDLSRNTFMGFFK